jgi:hypothetical protein
MGTGKGSSSHENLLVRRLYVQRDVFCSLLEFNDHILPHCIFCCNCVILTHCISRCYLVIICFIIHKVSYTLILLPVIYCRYTIYSICISSDSDESKKLPDDGRPLPKHVGASILNKGVVQLNECIDCFCYV